MAWQPDETQLRQLAGYLRDSLSGRDQNAQKYATLMLSQAKSSPDITDYLVYILKSDATYLGFPADQTILARSAAAISLKNLIKAKYNSIPQDKLDNIRKSMVQCLSDDNLQIRNFVGNTITELVRQGGVLGWPDVYGNLFSLAEDGSGHSDRVQEGAISALLKICEDNTKALNKDYSGQRPLDAFLPKLFQLMSSQKPKVRALALECVNIFLPLKPKVLLDSIDVFMNHLFQMAADPSDDVRRFVCRSFVQLVDTKPDALLPHMSGLVDYMVIQQRNTDEPDLALEAAEFWLSLGEHKELGSSLGPYLTKIIPTLLESMVYSEDDVARLEGERDDAEEEDREQDIKPQFAKSKRGPAIDKPVTNGINGANGSANSTNDDLSDGEIEEPEDEQEEDPEDEWNLRKCSAAALDVLASFFPEQIFEVSIPYLKANLEHTEWPNREAAVLAFGAVAEGCEAVVSPYLPDLIPFLLSLLQDKEPVVRKITCWALGRYTRWVVHLEREHPDQMSKYLEMTVDGVLKTMVDRNKSVQEGAASAFSTIEETAAHRLTPYCLPIVQQFIKCFEMYKDRNMFILYDCVQTLAEHVGPKFKDPEIESVLMPALIRRWQKVSDRSRELFPLLECLSYVAAALGPNFAPYALPIFSRCIQVVHQNLEQELKASQNALLDKPDQDFLVTSLDLLSSIIQALPEDKSGQLVESSEPRVFDLLRYCMQDQKNDVRQSSYALLGDCAIYLFPHLRPVLPALLPVLVTQLDIASIPDALAESSFAVINNACWSCGEIARQEQNSMAPYVDKIYERLYNIISNPEIPPSVSENAAIALGRLGLHCSQNLAPYLQQFAKPFLKALESVESTNEKAQAFMGLNRIIMLNPTALGDCLVEYLNATADILVVHPDREQGLSETFEQVLTGYKSLLPNFNQFIGSLEPTRQERLKGRYPIVR
ncbi:hypothetical protein MMC10_004409 [Thelotrema lepadinum]|nr:hypothetical protein [Thelotrema lepadinum]